MEIADVSKAEFFCRRCALKSRRRVPSSAVAFRSRVPGVGVSDGGAGHQSDKNSTRRAQSLVIDVVMGPL